MSKNPLNKKTLENKLNAFIQVSKDNQSWTNQKVGIYGGFNEKADRAANWALIEAR